MISPDQLSNYNQELSFRLQQDVTKYQEVNQIFRKLDFVGYVHQIYDLFHNIMNSEYQFTIQELKKLQEQEIEKFDFVEKYQVNSLIFKSNFQVICNSINDYLWVVFFNKAQAEFRRENHIPANNSSQVNSANKQEVSQEQQINTEMMENLQTQDFEYSEVKRSSNKRSHQESAAASQMIEQNLILHQQLDQIQQNNGIETREQQLTKVTEISQISNSEIQKTEGMTQKQKEEIVMESFIEDQQEKLQKYLNYDTNNFLNPQTQNGMSVMNLQKNLEWIVQNYPDLDKVIRPSTDKKESMGSVSISRVKNDSNDITQQNDTEFMNIKMVNELLEQQQPQQKVVQPLPIEGRYQMNKYLHFDRKFSTLKPQVFEEKLAHVQQLEKEKLSSSSQVSSAQKLKYTKDGKLQSSQTFKDNNSIPSQYPLRHSATQFYTNGSKKNLGDNLFYYDETEDIQNKLKKSNPASGSQSTRNLQSSLGTSGKRTPSYAFSKTPKVSVFSQQIKLGDNIQFNKFF